VRTRSTEPLGSIYLRTPHAEFGPGYTAGIGIELPLTKTLAFEVDGLFFQKGSRIELRDEFDREIIRRYLERVETFSLPAFYKWYVGRGDSPFLLAGVEVAFSLHQGPKGLDYGLVAGLGYRQRLGRMSLSLEARYHHGLRDLLTEDCILRKMRVFALLAGVSIQDPWGGRQRP
jgi:Outer membrane protein beta-barrel domain